jgi:hypothetical protein
MAAHSLRFVACKEAGRLPAAMASVFILFMSYLLEKLD